MKRRKELWVFQQTCDFFDDYDLAERLGGGAYGKVFKCIHKASKEVRAVKTIQKAHFSAELDLFRHEISIMRDLDHPHLIKFYGAYETAKLLFIVMELCEGGELFGYMRQKFAPRGCMHKCCPCLLTMFGLIKKSVYSEQQVAMWLRQVCEGLVYLHSKRIVHADIKPQNILLKSKDKNTTVRIIDFGLSSAVKKKHLVRGQDGTPEFMAPEVVTGRYTFHSDMWSFGVLIFTMLFGFSPFWTTSVYDTYHLIVDHGFKPDAPTPGFGNSFPSYISCSPLAKDLIIRLLQKDPIERLSASEALEHPWFSMASPSPIQHPVMNAITQYHQRSQLQKLVLNMLLQTLDESDVDDWQKTLPAPQAADGHITSASGAAGAEMGGVGLCVDSEDFRGMKELLARQQEELKKGNISALLMSGHAGSGELTPILGGGLTGSSGSKAGGAEVSGVAAHAHSNRLNKALQRNKGKGSEFPELAYSGMGASALISAAATGGDDGAMPSGAGPAYRVDRSVLNVRDLMIATLEHKLLAKEERIWSAFDQLDTDGNGVLTAHELSQALNIPLPVAQQVIREADVNGDGYLDLDEFVDQFLHPPMAVLPCTCGVLHDDTALPPAPPTTTTYTQHEKTKGRTQHSTTVTTTTTTASVTAVSTGAPAGDVSAGAASSQTRSEDMPLPGAVADSTPPLSPHGMLHPSTRMAASTLQHHDSNNNGSVGLISLSAGASEATAPLSQLQLHVGGRTTDASSLASPHHTSCPHHPAFRPAAGPLSPALLAHAHAHAQGMTLEQATAVASASGMFSAPSLAALPSLMALSPRFASQMPPSVPVPVPVPVSPHATTHTYVPSSPYMPAFTHLPSLPAMPSHLSNVGAVFSSVSPTAVQNQGGMSTHTTAASMRGSLVGAAHTPAMAPLMRAPTYQSTLSRTRGLVPGSPLHGMTGLSANPPSSAHTASTGHLSAALNAHAAAHTPSLGPANSSISTLPPLPAAAHSLRSRSATESKLIYTHMEREGDWDDAKPAADTASASADTASASSMPPRSSLPRVPEPRTHHLHSADTTGVTIDVRDSASNHNNALSFLDTSARASLDVQPECSPTATATGRAFASISPMSRQKLMPSPVSSYPSSPSPSGDTADSVSSPTLISRSESAPENPSTHANPGEYPNSPAPGGLSLSLRVPDMEPMALDPLVAAQAIDSANQHRRASNMAAPSAAPLEGPSESALSRSRALHGRCALAIQEGRLSGYPSNSSATGSASGQSTRGSLTMSQEFGSGASLGDRDGEVQVPGHVEHPAETDVGISISGRKASASRSPADDATGAESVHASALSPSPMAALTIPHHDSQHSDAHMNDIPTIGTASPSVGAPSVHPTLFRRVDAQAAAAQNHAHNAAVLAMGTGTGGSFGNLSPFYYCASVGGTPVYTTGPDGQIGPGTGASGAGTRYGYNSYSAPSPFFLPLDAMQLQTGTGYGGQQMTALPLSPAFFGNQHHSGELPPLPPRMGVLPNSSSGVSVGLGSLGAAQVLPSPLAAENARQAMWKQGGYTNIAVKLSQKTRNLLTLVSEGNQRQPSERDRGAQDKAKSATARAGVGRSSGSEYRAPERQRGNGAQTQRVGRDDVDVDVDVLMDEDGDEAGVMSMAMDVRGERGRDTQRSRAATKKEMMAVRGSPTLASSLLEDNSSDDEHMHVDKHTVHYGAMRALHEVVHCDEAKIQKKSNMFVRTTSFNASLSATPDPTIGPSSPVAHWNRQPSMGLSLSHGMGGYGSAAGYPCGPGSFTHSPHALMSTASMPDAESTNTVPRTQTFFGRATGRLPGYPSLPPLSTGSVCLSTRSSPIGADTPVDAMNECDPTQLALAKGALKVTRAVPDKKDLEAAHMVVKHLAKQTKEVAKELVHQ